MVWAGPGANLGPDSADRTGYGPGPGWCGPGRCEPGPGVGEQVEGQTSGWVRLRVGSDFREGDIGVGEAGEVYLAGGADEGLDVVVDVPDVDVHAGDHDAAGEPEGDEL